MAVLKNKALKNSLKTKAHQNATVTQGTSGSKTELKRGVSSEHSRKHLDGDIPTVGVSIGVTKNMENYQSLRVDAWLTDKVAENEDVESAYNRISSIVSEVVQEIVEEYLPE